MLLFLTPKKKKEANFALKTTARQAFTVAYLFPLQHNLIFRQALRTFLAAH